MAVKVKKVRAYYLWFDGVSSHDLDMVAVSDSGKILRRSLIKKGASSEKITASLEKFVAAQNTLPKGIAINQGVGSYTQARRMCAVANALGYAWAIPVVIAHDSMRVAGIIARVKTDSFVRAIYNGPGVG